MTEFTDARFMSAVEKMQLARGWRTFVKGGFQSRHFTKRIYEHLTLHCGHIAHFDRETFYSTWFEHGDDRRRFIGGFLSYRVMPDYADVQAVLVADLREHAVELLAAAVADEITEMRTLRAAVDARLVALGAVRERKRLEYEVVA